MSNATVADPIFKFVDNGILVQGDSTDQSVIDFVKSTTGGKIPLIIADPPYGNIVKEKWDRTKLSSSEFCDWMIDWTYKWLECLDEGAAFYVWGGIGKPGFRPFLEYLSQVEKPKKFELANLVTWKKRRGYGVQNNYLFTREECAFFIAGDAKKPRCFNVPYLDDKRGYAGFNLKYPTKSEFYRRTNVWTDITEMMSGKDHPTQKPIKLHEIMINIHTQPDDWVVDPFAGVGSTGVACKALGRRFVLIEKEKKYFDKMCEIFATSNVK